MKKRIAIYSLAWLFLYFHIDRCHRDFYECDGLINTVAYQIHEIIVQDSIGVLDTPASKIASKTRLRDAMSIDENLIKIQERSYPSGGKTVIGRLSSPIPTSVTTSLFILFIWLLLDKQLKKIV